MLKHKSSSLPSSMDQREIKWSILAFNMYHGLPSKCWYEVNNEKRKRRGRATATHIKHVTFYRMFYNDPNKRIKSVINYRWNEQIKEWILF
jgi:hypothetical protein